MRINLSFLTAIFSLTLLVSGFFVFNKVEATVDTQSTIASADISIGLPADGFKLNQKTEFTISTSVIIGENTPVIGNSTFSDTSVINSLEYYEVKNGTWYPLPANFGPAQGFPLSNATSTFRISFNKEGVYNFTINVREAADTSKIVASQEASFVVDNTAPIATAEYVEAGTIKYTFSEPVQLKKQDTGTITSFDKSLLKIYSIDALGNYGPEPVAGINITSAELVDKVLTIKYTGSLAKKIETTYVADTWGYSIIDMYGNVIDKNDPKQVIHVPADTTAPIVNSVSVDNPAKTIIYNFSEPVKLTTNEDVDIDFNGKLAIYGANKETGDYGTETITNNPIVLANLNSNRDELTITYTNSLQKQIDASYVVDAWGYKITDLAGNRMLPDLKQIFTVTGDGAAPTVTVTHDTDNKTITYKFSEPVKLISQADGKDVTFDPSLIKIYQIDIANGNYGPEADGMDVAGATFSGDTLTATYSGFLEKDTDTYYLIDAWGYDITDLVGNKIQKSSTIGDQIFELKAVKPTAGKLILTTKLHPEGIKSTPNDNGEYLLPDLQMDGADVFNSLTVEVSDINLDTNNVPVYVDGIENGYMHYTGSNNIWNYEGQSSRPNFDNGPHTLAATFKDLAGNTTPLVAKFTTDNIAPDLKSVDYTETTGGGARGQTVNKGVTITTEIGRIVVSMGATLTEPAKFVSGNKGDISITGPLMGSTSDITAPYGTFTISDDKVIITPNEGNAVLAHPGIFTFTVAAGIIQDEAGNKNGEVQFVLNVDSDHTAPKLTLNGDNNITVEYKKSYTDQGATFTDLVDGTYTIEGTPEVDTSVVGAQIIKYNATDKAGNIAAEITRTVTVVDVTKPIISAHENITAEATSSAGAIVEYTAPIVTDDYDTSISATCSPLSGSVFALGESIITCNAKDSSNNEAVTTTFKITVEDTTAPVITLTGTTPINIYRGDAYTDAGATATDNYDKEVVVTSTGVVDINKIGVYTITYSATDKVGNKATEVTRTVNVNKRPSSGGSRATPAIPAVPTVTPATPAVPAPGKVLGAEKFNFTLLLKKGMRGDEVMELQKLLNQLGFDCGIADGIFGAKTKAAVIKFQLANKLVGDGIVGPATRAVLNK